MTQRLHSSLRQHKCVCFAAINWPSICQRLTPVAFGHGEMMRSHRKAAARAEQQAKKKKKKKIKDESGFINERTTQTFGLSGKSFVQRRSCHWGKVLLYLHPPTHTSTPPVCRFTQPQITAKLPPLVWGSVGGSTFSLVGYSQTPALSRCIFITLATVEDIKSGEKTKAPPQLNNLIFVAFTLLLESILRFEHECFIFKSAPLQC